MAPPRRPRCTTCGNIVPLPPLERFTARVCKLVPEDTHARIAATIRAAFTHAEAHEPTAVLVLAFDLLARDLRDQGVEIPA